MRVKHRLYLAAGGLLALGIFAAGLDWNPVIAEVRWRSRVERVESHAEALRRAALESGQDPYLLAGLVYVESGGDPRAVSSVDALGLFQLRLPTAVERAEALGLSAPERGELLADPELNARLGAAYLTWLVDYCEGDLERALVCYNAGLGKVQEWIEEEGWEVWRAERQAAGNSKVLRYASDVVRFAERFRSRGRIFPSAVGDPAPAAGQAAPAPPRAPAPTDGFARPPGFAAPSAPADPAAGAPALEEPVPPPSSAEAP